jgi:hypothetical protein
MKYAIILICPVCIDAVDKDHEHENIYVAVTVTNGAPCFGYTFNVDQAITAIDGDFLSLLVEVLNRLHPIDNFKLIQL